MADLATTTSTPDNPLAAAVLRLRTQARAKGYNPDQPAALAALACVAGIEASHLAAVFTGRIPLAYVTGVRLGRVLTPAEPKPPALSAADVAAHEAASYVRPAAPRSQADEALRRALAATPIKAPSRPLSRRAAAVWGR